MKNTRQLDPKTEYGYGLYLRKLENLGIDIEDKKDVLDAIEHMSDAMKGWYLGAVVNKLRKDGKTVDPEYGKILRRISDDKVCRTITEKHKIMESKAFTTWDKILWIREEIKKRGDRQDCHVLASLYTLLPPQRACVYKNCYIDKDVEGCNIIDTVAGELVIRHDKVSKKVGGRVLKLCDELIGIILEWKPKTAGNDYRLFSTCRGKAFRDGDMGKFMERTFGEGRVTNIIRKIYTTYKLDSDMSLEERREMADNMRHSIIVQEIFYNKPSLIKK